MSVLKKRIITFVSIIIVLAVIIGLTLNIILSSIISTQVNNQLTKLNDKSNTNLSLDKIKINVFSSTLIIKGINLEPDSISKRQFANGEFAKGSQLNLYVSDVRVRGYNIFKLLMKQEVDISKIVVKKLSLNISKTKHFIKPKEKVQKSFSLSDSLKFKIIRNLKLGNIEVDNFNVSVFDVDAMDTIFHYGGKEVDIDGIYVEKIPNTDNYFELNAEKISVSMKEQKAIFDDKKYSLSFKEFKYSRSEKSILITEFSYEPTIQKEKLAASYKYDKEVYLIDADSILVNGIKIRKIIKDNYIDIDDITLNKLSVVIYKDKNNPPDYNRYPLFPQQALKRLKQDINIENIYLKNSYLSYSEISPRSDQPVFVDLTNMYANINGVCSVEDSIKNGKKLRIDLSANLMELAPLNLQLIMPYNSPVDTFYYSGNLGRSDLVPFNKALYPATGIKFKTGILNELQFSVKASPRRSEGEMLMLYEQLEAEVTKSKVEETDKTLSWLANLVLPSSNPSKRGKVKTAKIEFERVSYKGIGNLFWKSLQSGLVNTISPIGKTMEKRKNKRRDIKRKK
ncbi:MAG: hypothetical protein C0598_07595 [Marinilabiliales bacterium]|nr:MAG: hypothetical protein C0598_07595 [Marinilabiliales bacterium]